MSDKLTSPSQSPPKGSFEMNAFKTKQDEPVQSALFLHNWIGQLASNHFSCSLCNGLALHPRIFTSTTTLLACSSCAESRGLESVEAPPFIVGAVTDLNKYLSSKSALESGELYTSLLKESTPQRQFFVDATASMESPTRVGELSAKDKAQLLALVDEEMEKRTAILDEVTNHHLELQRGMNMRLKALKAQKVGSSKQVKMEADENYEKGAYSQAVQLYTKAISLSGDGATRLNVLYGNRSAALFMAQEYSRCIEDCLQVTQLEPGNVKLYSRAVKAAVMMGDLERAVQIHNLVDPSIVTTPMQNEHNKIVQAVDDLKEATRKHGTADGDRMWERLMTKFSETHVFRMQLADSVAMQGMFSKAIDLLNVLVPPNRPAAVAFRIAKYRYMSGFEHFENAKNTLVDYVSDSQCSKLLQLIKSVDEAKQDGNNLFASRNFAASVEQYTKAIELDLTNGKILRILYCNRAAAYKELGRYQEGVDDCTKAIELDPVFGKAFARRARCLMLQKNFDAAARDFRTALQYDPNDKEIARELKNAEDAIAKEIEKEKDFYYVLDVDSRATDSEIKTKYRALCLRWHPDKNADKSADDRLVAERKFKAINEAYSTLSNAEKRREYEIKRERERYSARGSAFDFMNRHATGAANAAKYTRTRHTTGNSAGTYGAYNTNNFW